MTGIAAASVAISGISGFFEILACLGFLVATIVAAIIAPRNWWAVGIAAGLLFWVLSVIVK